MSNESTTALGNWRVILAAILLAVSAGIAYWFWPGKDSEPTPTTKSTGAIPVDNDLMLPAIANPGYLGSQVCAECHAARFGEYKHTRHHWASTSPHERPMPEAFATGPNFASSEPSIRFQMAKENGQFVQKTIKSTPQGPKEMASQIGMVYGQGGKFDEVYFAWRDKGLYELPVTWLHPTKEWANVALNPHVVGDFSRTATTRCVECHTTWVGHLPGTANEYERSTAIFGVGCERCHGPGKEHVEHYRQLPKDKGPHGIVHPAKLDREGRINLCAQCHSNAALPADLPFTYRPGQPLDASYKTPASRFPEEEHVANQTKYMKESKCFQHSEMTCLTCHDPHKPTTPAQMADACRKCHQPEKCKEQPRLPEAVRDNCIGCHMPARVWTNVHFHTEKDRYLPPIRRFQHRIGVYSEATREVLLAWQKQRPGGAGQAEADKLTKSLMEHWLAEAEKYRKAHRFYAEMMALREAKALDPSKEVTDRLRDAIAIQTALDNSFADGLRLMEQKQFPAALASFNKMLEVDPDSARAHSRIGTIQGMLNKNDLAEKHLRKAAKENPADPYAFNMLGWMAYIQNRPADAIVEFLKAVEIDPANDEILYRLGLAYMAADKLAEGRKVFEKLYRLNPTHAGGCQCLSHILRLQKEPAEAVRYARRAAQLTEYRVLDILLTLSDAYTDAGRKSEAIETLERAIALADNPESADLLRQRLARTREATRR